MLTIPWSFSIWSKLERWKSLISGCLMSWLKRKKKKGRFEVLSSLILCNNKPFLDQTVMCDKKWILHDNQWWPVQWLDQEEAPKHFPKPNLHQKRSWSPFYLVVCCPSDSLQLSESWQNHYIWEICSANWWDTPKTATPAAGLRQQKGSNSSSWQCLTAHRTDNASKVERIGLWSFATSTILTWPLDNWLPVLRTSRQLFAGKMLPQPPGGRKSFPRVHQILKHGFLCYRNK